MAHTVPDPARESLGFSLSVYLMNESELSPESGSTLDDDVTLLSAETVQKMQWGVAQHVASNRGFWLGDLHACLEQALHSMARQDERCVCAWRDMVTTCDCCSIVCSHTKTAFHSPCTRIVKPCLDSQTCPSPYPNFPWPLYDLLCAAFHHGTCGGDGVL